MDSDPTKSRESLEHDEKVERDETTVSGEEAGPSESSGSESGSARSDRVDEPETTDPEAEVADASKDHEAPDEEPSLEDEAELTSGDVETGEPKEEAPEEEEAPAAEEEEPEEEEAPAAEVEAPEEEPAEEAPAAAAPEPQQPSVQLHTAGPSGKPMDWFVVRVQSGKEDRVRESLLARIKAMGWEDRFGRILVPSESITEIKGGRKRVVQRKIYPGYIMVELELSDDAWFLIRETPGIGDFVGPHMQPVPMQDSEIAKLLGEIERPEEQPKLKIDFEKGDSVKIKEGPFENFDGVVEEVVPAKGIVKVIVTIFGRATEVELEYWQVEAL